MSVELELTAGTAGAATPAGDLCNGLGSEGLCCACGLTGNDGEAGLEGDEVQEADEEHDQHTALEHAVEHLQADARSSVYADLAGIQPSLSGRTVSARARARVR